MGKYIILFREKFNNMNEEELMKEPTLGSPQNTIAVLQKYNFAFQKKFGQNFLIDTHVLDKIIRSAEITPEDMVLEIGPGIGTMTQYLACAAGKVIAVEIDRALIPILEDTLDGFDNVTVLNEDILKVDIAELAERENGGRPIKVVANLPYYITTPIIMGLFEKHVPVKSITVMVQKEVAERMQVGAGDKGLRRPVAGSAVLCKALYSGKCTAELFYAETKGRLRRDPAGAVRGAAGAGGWMKSCCFG